MLPLWCVGDMQHQRRAVSEREGVTTRSETHLAPHRPDNVNNKARRRVALTGRHHHHHHRPRHTVSANLRTEQNE